MTGYRSLFCLAACLLAVPSPAGADEETGPGPFLMVEIYRLVSELQIPAIWRAPNTGDAIDDGTRVAHSLVVLTGLLA